ncbi:MAG TPA: methyltransferase domain-containing protein [Solirubrobacteraceae bacterium]|jgi:ubiquinone/menaquinone biosynthesis C-methylase UbiE
MNLAHNIVCSSDRWARRVRRDLIPWGLDGVDLGDEVLELGPGFGATTRLLVDRVPRLSVLELDEGYCAKLREAVGDRVAVTQGDASAMPYPDGRFSSVVCFTMLHHLDPPQLQDRAFAEVARVLRPGGWFAGTDSLGAGRLFKLIHIGDKLALVDPERLPERLRAAGLDSVKIDRSERSLRFRAQRPR